MSAFVAVADLRGFAPAARRLGLSPSSVTRLVAALEAHLALRLLHRTTRSVSLTDAGSRYLERARRVLSDLAEAEAAARADAAVPAGRFVVSAPVTFGRREVAPLFSDFLRRHPRVVGELQLTDRNVHLVEDAIDAAVRIGHLDDSSTRLRVVGATRRVLVASPAYLAERPAPRRPADLARHATIQFTSLTPSPEWRFERDGRVVRVPLRPVFVTNGADAAITHARSGGGIAMVLSYQAADAIAAGALHVVLRRWEPPAIPIQIVYPATRLPSATLRAFIDLVVATCHWRFVDLDRAHPRREAE